MRNLLKRFDNVYEVELIINDAPHATEEFIESIDKDIEKAGYIKKYIESLFK